MQTLGFTIESQCPALSGRIRGGRVLLAGDRLVEQPEGMLHAGEGGMARCVLRRVGDRTLGEGPGQIEMTVSGERFFDYPFGQFRGLRAVETVERNAGEERTHQGAVFAVLGDAHAEVDGLLLGRIVSEDLADLGLHPVEQGILVAGGIALQQRVQLGNPRLALGVRGAVPGTREDLTEHPVDGHRMALPHHCAVGADEEGEGDALHSFHIGGVQALIGEADMIVHRRALSGDEGRDGRRILVAETDDGDRAGMALGQRGEMRDGGPARSAPGGPEFDHRPHLADFHWAVLEPRH